MKRIVCLALAIASLLTGCSNTDTTGTWRRTIPPDMEVQEGPPPLAPTYDVIDFSVKPVATFQMQPEYPAALRKKGIEGEATIDFVVGTDGLVYRARAVRSTNDAFATSATIAISHWRFRPGTKNGELANCHMQVPVVFALHDDVLDGKRDSDRRRRE